MAQINFKDATAHTCGELPDVGDKAPDFTLVDKELNDRSLVDFQSERVILNIFPSIDTPTCAASTRRFNRELEKHAGLKVLCVSADLPFAQARFCGAEGTHRVITLSSFRNPEFGFDYGVLLTDTALKGLFARALVVIDTTGRVRHTELVADIASEPSYSLALDAALAAD